MEKKIYTVTEDTMDDLDEQAIYQASMLVETLLEIAVIRDTEINEIVHRIETQGSDTDE